MNIYRCERDCTITVKDLAHCPRCGGRMLKDGTDTEENKERIVKSVKDRQTAYKEDYVAGKLFKGNL
jgi:hypothetical protein